MIPNNAQPQAEPITDRCLNSINSIYFKYPFHTIFPVFASNLLEAAGVDKGALFGLTILFSVIPIKINSFPYFFNKRNNSSNHSSFFKQVGIPSLLGIIPTSLYLASYFIKPELLSLKSLSLASGILEAVLAIAYESRQQLQALAQSNTVTVSL